jgi:hypothetical protein
MAGSRCSPTLGHTPNRQGRWASAGTSAERAARGSRTSSESAWTRGEADTEDSARGACDALAAAWLTSAGPNRPARYHTSAERWGRLPGLTTMPRWHAWWQGYAVALSLAGWLRSGEARRAPDGRSVAGAVTGRDAHGWTASTPVRAWMELAVRRDQNGASRRRPARIFGSVPRNSPSAPCLTTTLPGGPRHQR